MNSSVNENHLGLVMQSKTEVFFRLVKEFVRPGPVVVSPEATVEEVLSSMTERQSSHALVADPECGLSGIFTEKDVTRRVALRCQGTEPISAVMTAPVLSVRDSDYLYHAIARMRRYGFRHMPVIDAENQPIGILNLHEAFAFASSELVDQIDRLTQEETLDGLREVKAAQVEVAEELFAENLPAPEVQAFLTHINNDIYRRLVELELSNLMGEGMGEPPVAFEVIVMGSGGRSENFLIPDQDNGFIVAEYPDEDHTRIDGFFIQLAERLTQSLAGIGFSLCRGDVMATNPLWRKTLPQWQAQTMGWFSKQATFAAEFSDIFFDFQPVYGDGELAKSLRHHVTRLTQSSPVVLQEMFSAEADRHVALGFFGRLRTEREEPQHKGELNLKHGGILPLVGSIRLLSLKHGIEATPTIARIDALHQKNVLNDDETDNIRSALTVLTGFLLRQQLRDFKAGRTVSRFVPPNNLSRRERKLLSSSLQAVQSLQQRVRMEFTGDLF